MTTRREGGPSPCPSLRGRREQAAEKKARVPLVVSLSNHIGPFDKLRVSGFFSSLLGLGGLDEDSVVPRGSAGERLLNHGCL